MANENGAKVVGPGPQGNSTVIATHTDATKLDVRDGHLIVGDGGHVIAVYAPNVWRSARLDGTTSA